MIPIFIVSEHSSFFCKPSEERRSVVIPCFLVTRMSYSDPLPFGNITSQLQIGEINKVFFNSKPNY